MFWDILGIEPTKDKKIITNAYRLKLLHTNPEDKPEEFKALREAYEQALAYAETEETEKTSVDLWVEKLDYIYSNMKLRCSLSAWQELLSDDVCIALDTRMKAEDAMIRYFMDYYFLPHKVWQYLNQEFNWTDRVEELRETYPADFIDYIIVDGLNFEELLTYELYEPGEDARACEEYMKKFLGARNMQYEDASKEFAELRTMPEQHPIAEGYMLAVEIANGMVEKLEELEELTEKYNYNYHLSSYLTNTYLHQSDFEKALEAASKGLEDNPDDYNLKLMHADALAGCERYKDACEEVNELMDRAGGDRIQVDILDERRRGWNESIIKIFTDRLIEELSDEDKLSLAWAYSQNGKFDEALDVLNHMDEETTDPFDYNNLMSGILARTAKYDEAIEKLNVVCNLIENMIDDGTKKTQMRMKRLPEMISRKALIYYEQKKIDESLNMLDEALSLNPEDSSILTQATQIAYHFKKYERAEDFAHRLIKVNPGAFHAYLLLAKVLFMENCDRDSFEAINHAIGIYNGDLESYLLKLRLLIRNGAKDAAKELVEFLDNNGVTDCLDYDYCKGMIKEFFDEDDPGAMDIYKDIISKIEAGEYMETPESAYYRYLVLLGQTLDGNVKDDREKMFDICNKGLTYNANLIGLLDYKAWLLKKDGKLDESLEIYLDLAKIPRHSPTVDYQIGMIYYDNLDKNAEKALEYLLAAYDKGDTDGLFYIIYTLTYLDRLDEAEKYCLIYRKECEERGIIDLDSYYRMSYIQEKRKNYSEAYKENEIALEHALQKNSDPLRYLNHKIRLLRMMNKPAEAVKILEDNCDKYDEKYYHKTLHEVFIQFGMWEDALANLKAWGKKKGRKSESIPSLVELYTLMDDLKKAKATLEKNRPVMTEEDIREAMHYIDQCSGAYDRELKYYQDRIANHEHGGSAFDHIQLAKTYAKMGDRENKLKCAEIALEVFERTREKYSQSKAIDHIFLSKILICLERYDEAQKEIDAARTSTCDYCVYCSCKDADQFEVFLNMQKGEIGKALDLIEEKMDKWPDEQGFMEYLKLIKTRIIKE